MSRPPGTPNQERLLQQLADESLKNIDSKEKEILEDYFAVFESTRGRNVLADLRKSFAGITFTPGYPDVSAFKEGRRSLVEDIEQILIRARALMAAQKAQGGTE